MNPVEYPFTHGKGAYACPNWVTELLTNNQKEKEQSHPEEIRNQIKLFNKQSTSDSNAVDFPRLDPDLLDDIDLTPFSSSELQAMKQQDELNLIKQSLLREQATASWHSNQATAYKSQFDKLNTEVQGYQQMTGLSQAQVTHLVDLNRAAERRIEDEELDP